MILFSMKKILHITYKMNTGGAEMFLMNVYRTIDRSKFQFIFLCSGNKKFDLEDEIIELGGKVIRTPDVKDVGPIKHIRNLKKIIKDEKIDVINAQTYYNSMFSMIAGKLSMVKVRIVHSHTTQNGFDTSFKKIIYQKISKLIINNLSTKRLACEENAGKSLFTKKFTVIKNGIVLDKFKFNNPLRIKYRNELKINDSTTVIGHVGRLDKVKNHEFLIDTFNEYRKMNKDSALLLIGDGKLMSELKDKVSKMNITKNVIFLGNQSKANEFYNVMDYFVFPSLYEGLPLTLIEAQTNGLNCLISDSIEKKVKITDSITFYSLNRSAKDWAKKINIMNVLRLDNYPSMLKSEYNIEKVVNNLEVIYSGESND